MVLKLCTDAEGAEYISKAYEWLETTTQWSSVKGAARTAVAEYLANQDGKTLYTARSRGACPC